MSKLFTYCIPFDDGAAPNPFWGICSLVICKPSIRRVAGINDWIVATGSRHSPIGDVSGQLVYAMKLTQIMSMREYDAITRERYSEKIPDNRITDVRRKLGDSIYDFSSDPPLLRHGVHKETDRERDLGGFNALLSDHFYYFGDRPLTLPKSLLPIVKQGQGHRSTSNSPYLQHFIEWIEGLNLIPNKLYGNPQMRLFRGEFPLVEEEISCSMEDLLSR